MQTKLLPLLAVLTALPGTAAAQDRHGIVIAPPATPSELGQVRPRGLFAADTDFTLDYNSYSYDDRYHGPAPYYGRRVPAPPIYFYAPGAPAYRTSTGGTLYYWPR
jgi:hypothetical protein